MHGRTLEVPPLAQLILEEPPIRLFDILRQVREEHEGRDLRIRQLRAVLDLDVLAFPCGWGIVLDQRKELVVQLGRRDLLVFVLVHMNSRLYDLEDTLFGDRTREDDREVCKRRQALANGTFECFYILIRLAFYQIPLINADHQTLLVFLNQRVDIEVLRLDTACCIDHQDTYVRIFYRADGTYYRVVLQVLRHFRFLTDTGGVDEIEIFAEFIVPRVDAVARRSGDVGHDGALLTDKRVEDTRLAGIRTTYDRKAR